MSSFEELQYWRLDILEPPDEIQAGPHIVLYVNAEPRHDERCSAIDDTKNDRISHLPIQSKDELLIESMMNDHEPVIVKACGWGVHCVCPTQNAQHWLQSVESPLPHGMIKYECCPKHATNQIKAFVHRTPKR
jgi:hypothetical protein